MIFVADAADIVRGEIFCHVENLRCGDILDLEKLKMWRNFACGEL